MNTHIDGLVCCLHQSVDLATAEPALCGSPVAIASKKPLRCLFGGINVADIVIGEHVAAG